MEFCLGRDGRDGMPGPPGPAGKEQTFVEKPSILSLVCLFACLLFELTQVWMLEVKAGCHLQVHAENGLYVTPMQLTVSLVANVLFYLRTQK